VANGVLGIVFAVCVWLKFRRQRAERDAKIAKRQSKEKKVSISFPEFQNVGGLLGQFGVEGAGARCHDKDGRELRVTRNHQGEYELADVPDEGLFPLTIDFKDSSVLDPLKRTLSGIANSSLRAPLLSSRRSLLSDSSFSPGALRRSLSGGSIASLDVPPTPPSTTMHPASASSADRASARRHPSLALTKLHVRDQAKGVAGPFRRVVLDGEGPRRFADITDQICRKFPNDSQAGVEWLVGVQDMVEICDDDDVSTLQNGQQLEVRFRQPPTERGRDRSDSRMSDSRAL